MTAHFVNLLDELRRRSLRIASQVEDMLQEACECIFQPVETLAQRVILRDEEVDQEEVAVETEVVRLMALYQPVGSDLRLLFSIMKLTNDLERVADCAVNIAERCKHLEVQPIANDNEELKELCPLVRRILRNVVHSFATEDHAAATRVLDDDVEIDELYARIVRGVIDRASADADNIAAYVDVISVAKNLERIADHATNIAEDVNILLT
ncbi:MAG: phosphate signaling complex protein PhoU [Phycisphaerae bacterium]